MLGALVIAPGRAARVGDVRRDRGVHAGGAAALFAIPRGSRCSGTNVNRWQLVVGARREPVGEAFRAAVEQAGGRRAARDLPAAAAVDARARAQHRAAERREPAARQRRAQELRGIRARPRRGLGDAVRGHLSHATGRSRRSSACGRSKRFQLQVAREPGVEAVLGPASLLDRTPCCGGSRARSSPAAAQLTQLERACGALLRRAGAARPGLRAGASGADQLSERPRPGGRRLRPGRLARERAPACRRPSGSPTGVQRPDGPGRTQPARGVQAGEQGRQQAAQTRRPDADSSRCVDENRDSETKLSEPARQRPVGRPVGAAQPRQREPRGRRRPGRRSARSRTSQTALTALGPLQLEPHRLRDRARHERGRVQGDPARR